MARLPEPDTAGRIAIVGMSCRFPGAHNVAEYWTNLAAGVESIARFSEQDARASGVKPEFLRGRTHVKAAGALDRIEYFDAGFFGLTPREARVMDPQIRMFLECAWEALEDAGYAGERDGIQVGVYAGANISGYLLANLHATLAPTGSMENLMTLVGNDKDYLATHVSYKLNLKGPSVNVQTACSSSLVAVHLAGQALANHECDLALAGAVTVRVPHRFGYVYEEGGILSPDGHCRAFDAAGSGTVPGSGMGIVALKRLADAFADGDRIHAVIRGSAVNNDGSVKVGFTAPSVEGQAEVIALAQAMAGVDPAQIGYVEAHGTATPLGDACEIAALSQVFGATAKATGFCAIGSVKTNFGHLEAASGVAGLIKTVMALKQEALPPSLHFETPNPEIDFAASPFFVNTKLREWKRGAQPRLAGVSSFGVGGTNAHLIVEEAPERVPSREHRQLHVLVLSAKTEAALQELAERFDEYLTASTESLGDICFTAHVGRKQFAHRLAVAGETAAQMRAKLQAFLRGEPVEACPSAPPTRGRRVSLPTYPFQRQRYWIDLPDAMNGSVYSVEWALTPAGAPREPVAGDWLIVGDSAGLAAALRDRVGRCAESMDGARNVVCLLENCERALDVMHAVTERTQPPALWLVTQGAQAISVDDAVTAQWQAAVWGLGRVFALEHPEAWGGLIDLAPGDVDAAAAALWRELSQADREDQVALRAGGRFAPRLTRMQVAGEAVWTARSDAAYLITGGTGALGMKVAEWLVGTGARHLVLCSRKGAADVRRLEALGVRVTVVQADVTDGERMAALFEQIRQSGQVLRGVVHAAGVSMPRSIADLDAETLQATLAPKTTGAWNLHQLTRLLELDFFVCFSSVASVWGSRGFGAYAAGNQFLDSLMAHRRAEGLPGLAIDWGPWEGAGMASGDGLSRTGLTKLDPDTALRTMGGLIAQGASQVVVADVDWRVFKPAFEARRERPLLDRMAVGDDEHEPSAELARLLEAAPPAVKRAELARYLASSAAMAVGLDEGHLIDPRQGFFDLGMDSLTAVEFRNRLQDAVGKAIALPRTLVFDYPTLEALGGFLAERLLGTQSEARPAVPVRREAREPIAIVGMGCRFPGGAGSPESFWRLMREGSDAVTEVPADRWPVDDYYDPNPDAPGKTYSRYGAFLRGVDRFDAAFFGIAPREAASMDPQQRLLLEVAWKALENAGLPADELAGTRSGVYIGISTSDYLHLLLRSGDFSHVDSYAGIGNVMSAAAGRLSYVLGLQGPSMAVDTACSSSLVAVHLAARSLRSGECDMALAGGVNLILSPATHVNLSRARMLSRDGRCKAFDADADGFVRGEGCGVVVLKRLSDALAAGDPVLAVIHGSAVNQDGRSGGITVPNGPAQQAVVRQALADGGIEPAEVDYVEAHGTGTSLGDPIEVQALGAVLAEGRAAGAKVPIGAVKTNIGHLEGAAGIAGLIKVVLSLQHQELPPHGHLKSLNPAVEWRDLTVEVGAAGPRRLRVAGVSSFGFSGTNAHVVLGAAPRSEPPVREPRLHRLTLSAKSDEALRALAACYEIYLSRTIEHLGDICFTAEVGRASFAHRATFAGETVAQMCRSLREWITEENDGPSYRSVGYRKVTLPSYPFQRERCWFAEVEERRLYSLAWERAGKLLPRVSGLPQDWVIVGDGGTLPEYLAARGIRCSVQSPAGPIPAGASTVVYCAGERFGCAELLPVVQELAPRGAGTRLWIVTHGTQPVGDPARINLEQAPLWGFGRVVALEHPEIWGGLIDLDDDSPTGTIAEHILAPEGEDQVAFRNGARFVPRLVRDADLSAGSPRIEPEGWYLITGGLGALGLQVANWLVRHGARHLVLVGRSPAPPETARALEAGCATVRVVQADVQDAARMAELVQRPGLRGIVHAAGVMRRQPVAELDAQSLEAVMGPKVTGAWNLHQATAHLNLDFFVMFSSIASVWGSSGMAAYAAANHFLDALAHYRRGLGLTALSINWGAWDAGMTGAADRTWLSRTGVGVFSPAEGSRLFGSLLGATSAQRIAASVDWDIFVPVMTAKAARPIFERMSRQGSAPAAPRDGDFLRVYEATPVNRRPGLLAGRIQEEVARVMGIASAADVDPQRGFFDMGMDSLMAVELRNRLEGLVGRPLHSSVIFNYSNVAALAGHIASTPGEIAETAAPVPDAVDRELQDISDAEAERLLMQELATMEGSEIG